MSGNLYYFANLRLIIFKAELIVKCK